MPESIQGSGRDSHSRIVVSQLQGETVAELRARLEHRLSILASRQQTVESAVLMVGAEAVDDAGDAQELAMVLSDSLHPEGELSLMAQPGAPEVLRAHLYDLFDAVASSQRGTKKGVTARFLASSRAGNEAPSGVWSCSISLGSDVDVA